MQKVIYLASPYTHPESAVLEARCRAAQQAAAQLMQEGVAVFSPIAHSHGVADFMPETMRLDGEFWLGQDLPLLARCDELHVLCLPGWEASKGVQAEIAFARERDIPVTFIPQAWAMPEAQ